MSTQAMNTAANLSSVPVELPRLEKIRQALAIDTTRMGGPEINEVWKMASLLAERICCEQWGVSMGWDIPKYGTPEWQEMYRAWLEDDQD